MPASCRVAASKWWWELHFTISTLASNVSEVSGIKWVLSQMFWTLGTTAVNCGHLLDVFALLSITKLISLFNVFLLLLLEYFPGWAFLIDYWNEVSSVFCCHPGTNYWITVDTAPSTHWCALPIFLSTLFSDSLTCSQIQQFVHDSCLAGWIISWSKWLSHISNVCILQTGKPQGFKSMNWTCHLYFPALVFWFFFYMFKHFN